MREKRTRDIPALLIFVLAFMFCVGVICSPSLAGEGLVVGAFSAAQAGGPLPEGWAPLTFRKIKNHTRYDLVSDAGVVVVRATSSAASSGLVRQIRIDPRRYPVIKWRWKVMNTYEKGDVTRKEGDDYPARIYIMFEYDPKKIGFFRKAQYTAARLLYGEYPPTGAINYIWGSKAKKGMVVPNPYTDRAMMIVAQSGKALAGTWVEEQRNVYEDYRNAFGEEPPFIGGVAIMTDTDNTGTSGTAYYGDIVFETSF